MFVINAQQHEMYLVQYSIGYTVVIGPQAGG